MTDISAESDSFFKRMWKGSFVHSVVGVMSRVVDRSLEALGLSAFNNFSQKVKPRVNMVNGITLRLPNPENGQESVMVSSDLIKEVKENVREMHSTYISEENRAGKIIENESMSTAVEVKALSKMVADGVEEHTNLMLSHGALKEVVEGMKKESETIIADNSSLRQKVKKLEVDTDSMREKHQEEKELRERELRKMVVEKEAKTRELSAMSAKINELSTQILGLEVCMEEFKKKTPHEATPFIMDAVNKSKLDMPAVRCLKDTLGGVENHNKDDSEDTMLDMKLNLNRQRQLKATAGINVTVIDRLGVNISKSMDEMVKTKQNTTESVQERLKKLKLPSLEVPPAMSSRGELSPEERERFSNIKPKS